MILHDDVFRRRYFKLMHITHSSTGNNDLVSGMNMLKNNASICNELQKMRTGKNITKKKEKQIEREEI